MKKTFLSLVILLGTFATIENATAGGGTLNPVDPPRGGGTVATPASPNREAPLTSLACPTAIYSAADIVNEGRLEVFATAHHARTYVGTAASCHYHVETLTLDGVSAQAVDELELEFYSAGRMFLSLITPNGEKARYVASNGRAGEKGTASLFIVPGFEPAELYNPIRTSSADDIKFTVATSKQIVPVQN